MHFSSSRNPLVTCLHRRELKYTVRFGFIKLLAERLDWAGGTLGFRGTPVENHCATMMLYY